MRSRRIGVNRRRLVVLAAPAVMAIPAFLHAQTFTATPSGDYTLGVNWSTNPTAPTASTNPQISNGGTATIGDGETGLGKNLSIGIGGVGTGTGSMTLSSSATYTGSGAVSIGTVSGGSGTLINSGTFTTTGNIMFGNAAGANGTLVMSGGSLSIISTAVVALGLGQLGAGTLLQSGGTITLPSTGTFGLGRGAAGYYDMEAGTFNIGGVFQMASGSGGLPTGVGTFIQNGGTITANLVTFAANGQATCTMNGGTLISATGLNLSNNAACISTVTQGNNEYVATGSLDISVGSTTGAASVATYSMSSGILSVGTTMIVGGTSTTLANGTFNQTGGFLSVGSAIFVGDGTLSTGMMNVSGTGSIVGGAASSVYVGTSGSGTFNLCSLAAGTSSLSAGTIQVGSVSSSATGEVDSQFLMGSTSVSGALPTVTVGTIDFGQTDAFASTNRLFSIASGTLTVGMVDLTSYDSGGNALNQATFQQLGGTGVATVSIGSMNFAGGVYQVGNATASPVVVNSAALFVNPAGMGVLLSGVTATYAGGGTIATTGSLTLNGALTNNGAVLDVGAATNGTGTVSFRGAQTNAVGSGITVNSGQVNLQTDGGTNLTFTVSNAGKAVIGGGTFVNGGMINATENLGTLSILGGGVARMFSTAPAAMPNVLLHAGTLSIHGDAVPTGTLDLAADDAIVDNGVFSTIQAQVKSGYSSGTWSGPGIRSSVAALTPGVTGIGYASVSEIGTTTFDGVSGLSPSAVVLKYTLLGDANMDGTVNALDFNALATNFGQGGEDWAQGDFNYSADGTVDSNDFALLAANYGKTVGGLSAALPDTVPAMALGTLVPEPASIGLLMAFGVGVMSRRRRV